MNVKIKKRPINLKKENKILNNKITEFQQVLLEERRFYGEEIKKLEATIEDQQRALFCNDDQIRWIRKITEKLVEGKEDK